MRPILALFVFGLAIPGYADQPGDPAAIIDRAIKAAGGRKNLAKCKTMTWSEKGNFYGMGNAMPYTAHYAARPPSQFRMEIENVFTAIVDGEKGWLVQGESADDLPKEQLEGYRELLYSEQVRSLLPLADKEFKLTALPEAKVGDKPAEAVRVSHAGHPDITLYFDKAGGLVIKSEMTVKSREQGGKEVKQETVLAIFAMSTASS